MVKLFNDNEELSIAFNALLPMVYSDDGEFEIDKTIYSSNEWEEKKQQLHLLWCRKLTQYHNSEKDDYILGFFTAEGLKKIKEQKINV